MADRHAFYGQVPLRRRGVGLRELAQIIEICQRAPATALAVIDDVAAAATRTDSCESLPRPTSRAASSSIAL